MFQGRLFTTTDLLEVGKVMIFKVNYSQGPERIDLRLTLIQFLCLNTLNAYQFSLGSIYF